MYIQAIPSSPPVSPAAGLGRVIPLPRVAMPVQRRGLGAAPKPQPIERVYEKINATFGSDSPVQQDSARAIATKTMNSWEGQLEHVLKGAVESGSYSPGNGIVLPKECGKYLWPKLNNWCNISPEICGGGRGQQAVDQVCAHYADYWTKLLAFLADQWDGWANSNPSLYAGLTNPWRAGATPRPGVNSAPGAIKATQPAWLSAIVPNQQPVRVAVPQPEPFPVPSAPQPQPQTALPAPAPASRPAPVPVPVATSAPASAAPVQSLPRVRDIGQNQAGDVPGPAAAGWEALAAAHAVSEFLGKSLDVAGYQVPTWAALAAAGAALYFVGGKR